MFGFPELNKECDFNFGIINDVSVNDLFFLNDTIINNKKTHRKIAIGRWLLKRKRRLSGIPKIKYSTRSTQAKARPRNEKGRFITVEDEMLFLLAFY